MRVQAELFAHTRMEDPLKKRPLQGCYHQEVWLVLIAIGFDILGNTFAACSNFMDVKGELRIPL